MESVCGLRLCGLNSGVKVFEALLERTENLMDSFGAPIRDLQQDYKKEN